MKSGGKPFAVFTIICLGVIVYSNSFFCSFQFDDGIFIVNNFAIRHIHHLLNIWNFYPTRFITFLSIAANYHLNRLDVFGYHLFNLIVHLITAILVWWLTLLTLSTPAMKDPPAGEARHKITQHANTIALLAGMVFVSHPIQTEAVTYIWQRTSSMAAMFYLASLCLYVKSRSAGASPGHPNTYYIFSLIFAVVAMFTKENTVTLPLMVLLYEFSFLEDRQGLKWKYVFPFLLTLCIIPLTVFLTKLQQFKVIQRSVEQHTGASPLEYLLTQLRVIVTYIRLVFLPLHQNIDYDYSISKSILELPVLFSFFLISAIFLFAKNCFLKYRLVFFSIFWFFLTLLPESSFFPLGNIIFEHRLYLPLVGYSMFLVGGMYYLLGVRSFKMMVIVLMGIIIFYSILTYQRNKIWKDDVTLWNDAVGKSPLKARPYVMRGVGFFLQGNYGRSLFDLNKSIALYPNYPQAYTVRGIIYEKKGKLVKALIEFTKSIMVDPTYGMGYYHRAVIDNKLGQFSQAIFDATQDIDIDPKDPEPYIARGVIYGGQGNLARAISDFNKSIEIDPNFSEAYVALGDVYYEQGRYIQAVSAFNKALHIDPNNKDAYINRVVSYIQLEKSGHPKKINSPLTPPTIVIK